jgi:hypothetical protein
LLVALVVGQAQLIKTVDKKKHAVREKGKVQFELFNYPLAVVGTREKERKVSISNSNYHVCAVGRLANVGAEVI